MSQFVFFAVLLGAIAIAFAVSALWQTSRKLALALALGLPLAAAGLYHALGEPAALDARNVTTPTTVEDAVAQLENRLAGQPETFENLVVLARARMAVGKFDQARDAYAKAMRLQPEETDLAVEYAEALLRSSTDRRFPPEAVGLLEAAIENNPGNQRALFFLGLHHMQSGQPAEAAATWERLLPLLTPETAGALREQIAAARTAAGLPPLAQGDIASGPGLTIELAIDPTLADLARPGDTVFVFARGPGDSGPPLAARRIRLERLPMRLRLTDADSPMPAAKLSSQATVTIVARLSRSGDASAASGDIEADPVEARTVGDEPVELILSRVRP